VIEALYPLAHRWPPFGPLMSPAAAKEQGIPRSVLDLARQVQERAATRPESPARSVLRRRDQAISLSISRTSFTEAEIFALWVYDLVLAALETATAADRDKNPRSCSPLGRRQSASAAGRELATGIRPLQTPPQRRSWVDPPVAPIARRHGARVGLGSVLSHRVSDVAGCILGHPSGIDRSISRTISINAFDAGESMRPRFTMNP